MRKSKFSEAEMIAILRQAEAGVAVTDLFRKQGISLPTFYPRWKKYGGVGVPEVQRVQELERERVRLKRMLADEALELTEIKVVLHRKD